MYRTAQLLLALGCFALVGCSGSDQGPLEPIVPKANALLGRIAFDESCSGCHASRDGFDLKTFAFTDTTIIRRAVGHVDSTTARNIVAYIRSIPAPVNEENMSLFQPKAATVGSDIEFSIALFGRDQWPTDLTTAGLAAIDPRAVRIAIRLPIWSDEASNKDWMPDSPLPPGVLHYAGGAAAAAVAGYQAAPTRENLMRAVAALRTADRASANPAAPCMLEDTSRVNYRECFEVRRWTSTLVALHLLRSGMDVNLGGTVHDIWWDVGNAARKSRADRTVPIANPVENWTSWMFLGWSFDPSRHSSSYTGGGFRQLGLMRHATFVALRSQVARPRNSLSVYEDLVNAVRFSPSSWTSPVASSGLRHLTERLTGGDRPNTAEQLAMAVTSVNAALTEAYKKVPAADRPALTALAQPVLAALSKP